MRIEQVRARIFTHTTFQDRDSEGHNHPSAARQARKGVLTLRCENGVEGHALGAPELMSEALLGAFVRPVLTGADPLCREALWQRMEHAQRGSGGLWTDKALAIVDVALWDLAGKLAGVPVWKLAGGCRDKVPAYGSTMCGDDIEGGLSTPDEYGRFALALKARGYQGIKLHTWMPPIPGAPDVRRDIAACHAVREAVGQDFPLMLDAFHWYSRMDALKLGRAIEALGYEWFEEPMDESAMVAYRWLASELRIPVIGPESAWGKLATRTEWAASGACDILRTGVNDVGGITPALKCMHMAEGFAMDCEVHGSGLANLAVSAAAGNSRWYERGLLHPLLDHDRVPEFLLRASDPMDAEGFVHLPEEPGLGEALNWDWIDAHTVSVK
jgi:L-alanine-DL-glutamate epimerase-like enolase superfamily enzyme